jgi:hypothetical protein
MKSALQLSTINDRLAQRQHPYHETAHRFLIKARLEMANRE